MFIRGECCGDDKLSGEMFLSYFHDTNLTMDFALEILFRWQKMRNGMFYGPTTRVSHNEKLKGVSVARMIKMSDTIK